MTQGPDTGSQPPGWHPDPWGHAGSRWWDGESWTDQTRPMAPPSPSSAVTPYRDPHPVQQVAYYQQPGAVVPHDVNRILAAVFALFLGGLGIHKFYCKKTGLGILYLLFFWTFIPAFVALVEGIIYLVQDDAKFARAQGLIYAP